MKQFHLPNLSAMPSFGESLACLPTFILVQAVLVIGFASLVVAAPNDDVEFFEKKIRPVLAQHCYQCHNSSKKQAGGLALDYQAALLAGGDSGDAIVPGKPEESILIWALRHENGYEMPSKAPKLSDAVIADFVRWIKTGAADPRLKKPTADELAQRPPWEEIRNERAKWWSFQPLGKHETPKVTDSDWSTSNIDRFVFARLQADAVAPQPAAEPAALIRRVHLVLTGLPPEPEVVAEFERDPSPAAYQRIVDQLLASKAFGETWARHWMDWYRYAETHGSEGDPQIPHAKAYRDYLIRAFNADTPYDQLLREHLAGDLLANPRINDELGLNESAIGPAHLRMAPHGFGVTDAYGEQITFTDNQIDVISKAMLGVTVSCARCHNHKFDPISQKDFYRFYGVMVSCRPSTVLIDPPARLATNRDAMTALKKTIRKQLADYWLSDIENLAQRIESHKGALPKPTDIGRPLHAWSQLKDRQAEDLLTERERIAGQLKKVHDENQAAIENAAYYVDLREPNQSKRWNTTGNSTADEVSAAGSFAIQPNGDSAITAIYPRGIYSHLLSDKHAAVLSTTNFTAAGKQTWVRSAGDQAELRAPIRSYPLSNGLLHRASSLNQSPTLAWRPVQNKWQYWQGEKVHYELRTSRDVIPNPGNSQRSWFGVTEIIAADKPLQNEGTSLLAITDDRSKIVGRESLLQAYVRAARQAVSNWRLGKMTDEEAQFLDTLVQLQLLRHRVDQLPAELRGEIERYRKLDAGIPEFKRAPGVIDSEPIDQPLLVRGDYRQEAEPVARQFLEIFNNRPYPGDQSGRLQLAEDILSDRNTLKSRVLINRLWAYVFGRGIVASTDNFGRLGSEPTHPELLDTLALQFEADGWSMKRTLRQMVLSRTFRASSQAPSSIRERDPENRLLSFYTPRRLSAEAIYDSVGRLRSNQQRAIYLPVVRNRLHPFLTAFNYPTPTSTVSSRTLTNTPTQSLAMMNGDFVEQAARAWSNRVAQNRELPTPVDKITHMVRQAFSRSPTTEELEILQSFLNTDDGLADLLAEQQSVLNEQMQTVQSLQNSRDQLLAPIRERLQKQVDQRNAERAKSETTELVDLKPIARWSFDENGDDGIGALHGSLVGKARIEGGALVLEGGFMKTKPLAKPLGAKTLEAVVQLDRLDQRGGAAMTVQTLNGNVFDAIVYGEAIERKWLAGSDFFKRTSPLNGPTETTAGEEPVRIALVYHANGSVQMYRNGQPYADAYRKAALQSFAAGQSQVMFGLRHGVNATNGRILTGKIFEAQLFDRALTAEEVAASANATLVETVSAKMVDAELDPQQKRKIAELNEAIAKQQTILDQLGREVSKLQDRSKLQNGGYYGIAHALLNAKEFRYVY